MKDWIEESLTRIWKLDAVLNLSQIEGETDLEGVAVPSLRGLLRHVQKAPQNQKPARTSSLKTHLKALTKKEGCGVLESRLI